MNMNMIQLKNHTQLLLLSITENGETLNKQTQTKPQETLEFKPNQPRTTFSFKPSISIERSWMIGLTSLLVYNSVFKITEVIKKLELYTDTFDMFSFTE